MKTSTKTAASRRQNRLVTNSHTITQSAFYQDIRRAWKVKRTSATCLREQLSTPVTTILTDTAATSTNNCQQRSQGPANLELDAREASLPPSCRRKAPASTRTAAAQHKCRHKRNKVNTEQTGSTTRRMRQAGGRGVSARTHSSSIMTRTHLHRNLQQLDNVRLLVEMGPVDAELGGVPVLERNNTMGPKRTKITHMP